MEADRLRLRQFRDADLEPYLHIVSDPENTASRRVAEKLGGSVDKTGLFHDREVLFYGYGEPPP